MKQLNAIVLLCSFLISFSAFAVTGDTIPSADGRGYHAVVRGSSGGIVWAGGKTYNSEKKAQKKADKIAKEIDSGVMADPNCDENPRINC